MEEKVDLASRRATFYCTVHFRFLFFFKLFFNLIEGLIQYLQDEKKVKKFFDVD